MILVSDFANGESVQQLKGWQAEKEGKGNACKAKTIYGKILPFEKKLLNLHEKTV